MHPSRYQITVSNGFADQWFLFNFDIGEGRCIAVSILRFISVHQNQNVESPRVCEEIAYAVAIDEPEAGCNLPIQSRIDEPIPKAEQLLAAVGEEAGGNAWGNGMLWNIIIYFDLQYFIVSKSCKLISNG